MTSGRLFVWEVVKYLVSRAIVSIFHTALKKLNSYFSQDMRKAIDLPAKVLSVNNLRFTKHIYALDSGQQHLVVYQQQSGYKYKLSSLPDLASNLHQYILLYYYSCSSYEEPHN